MISKYDKQEIQAIIFDEMIYWIEEYRNLNQVLQLMQEGINEIQLNNHINFKPYKKYIIKTMRKFKKKVKKLI